MRSMPSRISCRYTTGLCLEGIDGVLFRAFLDDWLQEPACREVDSFVEDVLNFILQLADVQKAQAEGGVILGHQVYVGVGTGLVARGRAEECKMQNALGLQFRRVVSKFGNDFVAAHVSSLAEICCGMSPWAAA